MPPRAQRDPDLYNAGWGHKRPPVKRSRPVIERPLLSPRQVEILTLLAEGLNRVEIAERLVISNGTCRNHCKAIFERLGVHTAAEAVGRGLRDGLIH